MISVFLKKKKLKDDNSKLNTFFDSNEITLVMGKNQHESELDNSVLLNYIDNENNSELHFLDDQLNGNYRESETIEYFGAPS